MSPSRPRPQPRGSPCRCGSGRTAAASAGPPARGAGCAPWARTLPSPSPALPEVSWTPALGGGASSQAQVTELCTPKKHDANSLAQVTGRHRVHLRVVVRPAAPPAGAARRGVRCASLSARASSLVQGLSPRAPAVHFRPHSPHDPPPFAKPLPPGLLPERR